MIRPVCVRTLYVINMCSVRCYRLVLNRSSHTVTKLIISDTTMSKLQAGRINSRHAINAIVLVLIFFLIIPNEIIIFNQLDGRFSYRLYYSAELLLCRFRVFFTRLVKLNVMNENAQPWLHHFASLDP